MWAAALAAAERPAARGAAHSRDWGQCGQRLPPDVFKHCLAVTVRAQQVRGQRQLVPTGKFAVNYAPGAGAPVRSETLSHLCHLVRRPSGQNQPPTPSRICKQLPTIANNPEHIRKGSLQPSL